MRLPTAFFFALLGALPLGIGQPGISDAEDPGLINVSLPLLLVQDTPPDTKEETITLDVKVGQREGGVMNIPGFKTNEPLVLTGKPADPETLRPILLKGIDYLLGQQAQDGSWAYNRTQLRKKDSAGKEIKPNQFAGTAQQSMSKTVLTSLAGMALRRHLELAPDKIKPAIEKGLRYVLDNAHRWSTMGFDAYRPWSWAFTLNFLNQEYKATQDAKLKEEIRKAGKVFVDLLVQNQHKGKREPKAVAQDPKKTPPASQPADKKDDKPREKRTSNGGFFGIVPAEDDEFGKEGILIDDVVPKGPAAQGGLRKGDRIMAIDGHEIEDIDDLYELIDSFKGGTVVKVKVLREANPPKKEKTEPKKNLPVKELMIQQKKKSPWPEDGGWAYYNMGAISFTTATCLLGLMDAKEMGLDVPQDAIDRGITLIQSLRMQREDSDEWGFAYHTAEKVGKKRTADIRASVGRLGVCGLALLKAGKISTDDLAKLMESFVRHRGELDRVKGYPTNHFARSFLNAAYYFLYGHYHAARALNQLPNAEQRKKLGAFVQEALIKSRNEEEGTWTDHEMWGQVYGTAMALMALGELKDLVPSLYKTSVK